jgi:hypothetical protein
MRSIDQPSHDSVRTGALAGSESQQLNDKATKSTRDSARIGTAHGGTDQVGGMFLTITPSWHSGP